LQFAAPTESGIVMNIPEHDPVVIEERLAWEFQHHGPYRKCHHHSS
jgi:hypothetical protein